MAINENSRDVNELDRPVEEEVIGAVEEEGEFDDEDLEDKEDDEDEE